jgi:hypothetical protein
MTAFKRISSWILKGLGVLVLLAIILFAVLMFVSRQEKELTREFFGHLGNHRFDEAHALLDPELKLEYPLHQMKADFGDTALYNDVSFAEIKASTNEGTLLGGQAATGTGCVSGFRIRFVAERIVQFHINPLCYSADRST